MKQASSKLGLALVIPVQKIFLCNIHLYLNVYQSFQDFTNPRLQNLVRNFDLSMELPDLVQKIAEKYTFHGIGEISNFLSTEFPLSECRILGSLSQSTIAVLECKSCIFRVQNFDF